VLSRLSHIAAAHPRRILAFGALVLVLAGALGAPAQTSLKARNDFEDPGSAAAAARTRIEHATGAEPSPGVLALVKAAPGGSAVDSAERTLKAERDVFHAGPLVPSKDGRATLIPVTLKAGLQDNDAVDRLIERLRGRHDVLLGGAEVAQRQVGRQVSSDLGFAEAIVFPLLAGLALLFFRGRAAALPLLTGATSILTTFALLRAINAAFPLSIFALNLVIGLGLGLAVDYSLFMVSRFREELSGGAERARALRTTLQTAGRTVVFSALTVAAALISLTVFPLRFLQSMGIGGAVVALTAATVSLTLLPAVMYLMAPHIAHHRPTRQGEGRWYGLAQAVMRRPALVAIAAAAVMLVVALPSLNARWAGVDASVLPTSQSARVVSDELATSFPGADATPMTIAVDAPAGAAGAVRTYAASVADVPQVASVGEPRYLGAGTWQIDATARGPAIGDPAQKAIDAVRALPGPPAEVGGTAATFHDRQAAIAGLLPLALALLVITTLVILWVMTGSVVLPLKALIMNALTVGVATGVLVWIFQDGRLTDVLGYRGQGGIESTDFLVLVSVAFALSTDYGVFLLTRIKEARERGLDNREAVAVGVQRTGTIVSAAAILLAVAIGAFAASKIIFIKEIGVGAVVAVLVDAFLVRSLLVPSLMALLGEWNWWQPRPLRGLHMRLATLASEG
jgi:RND superfamily putative drug exporter